MLLDDDAYSVLDTRVAWQLSATDGVDRPDKPAGPRRADRDGQGGSCPTPRWHGAAAANAPRLVWKGLTHCQLLCSYFSDAVEFIVTTHDVSSVKAWSTVPKAIFFIVRQHGHVAWGDGQSGKRERERIRWKLWG